MTLPSAVAPSDTALPIEPPALVYPEPLTATDSHAYLALRTNAAWFESGDHWSSFVGPKAAESLNGLVTNDVSVLQPGQGLHAAALTVKGKVLCDMFIMRVDEHTFLMSIRPSCAAQWIATAKKYVNPRLAKVTDESARYAGFMLYGVNASALLTQLSGNAPSATETGDTQPATDTTITALAAWPDWSHGPRTIGAASVRVIRAPLMGSVPGFIIMADAHDANEVRAHLASSAAVHASPAVWNLTRIESGRPAWGIDMDDHTIPQEANLGTLGAISFTKGCYTGQETVARLHFRGHVNKQLRALQATAPMPTHARLLDANGKDVGDVRSTVISPRLGPIAIAMVRREIALGAVVLVQATDTPIPATVSALPFPE